VGTLLLTIVLSPMGSGATDTLSTTLHASNLHPAHLHGLRHPGRKRRLQDAAPLDELPVPRGEPRQRRCYV
jgi:hypothetical protein